VIEDQLLSPLEEAGEPLRLIDVRDAEALVELPEGVVGDLSVGLRPVAIEVGAGIAQVVGKKLCERDQRVAAGDERTRRRPERQNGSRPGANSGTMAPEQEAR
jgi:hypothetical protein